MQSVTTVLKHTGPFASAYVDVSRDVEDADKQIELRTRSVGERLVDHGCPESTADRVIARLREPTGVPGLAARMVVANEEHGIILDDVILRPGSAQVTTWSDFPDLLAWIADRDAMPGPVLQVLADREGADLAVFRDWPGQAVDEEHVHGETMHINKVAGGEYAHQAYQRRTARVWRRNAEEVADEISSWVTRGVTWVALTGDLHAVGQIHDVVDEPTRALLVDLDTGGRAAGSSEEVLEEAMDRAALDVVARRRAAIAADLAEQFRHDGAVSGVSAVLDALAQGQVRTVVADPPTLADQVTRLHNHLGVTAPSGAGEHSADPRGSATGGPDTRGRETRADLAIVSQAARTDADVVVTSDPGLTPPRHEPGPLLHDGVAAILRWSTS